MRLSFPGLAVLALLTMLPGRVSADQPGRLAVWTSLPPLAWLADEIGKGRVTVKSLIQSGQDPHTFSPRPKQILAIEGADAFLHCGSDFEQAVAGKLARMYPGLEVIDLRCSDEKPAQPGPAGDASHDIHGHSHDHNHDHSREDPHVWFSVKNLSKFGDVVARLLAEKDPRGAETFSANLDSLKKRLAGVDAEFTRKLAPLKGKAFYVHHPAFGHFAADYGLTQKAVELHGKDPSPRQLLAVIESAKRDGVKTVVASPQFADRPSRILAKRIGGRVVRVDPLDPDPIAAMRLLAAAIAGD